MSQRSVLYKGKPFMAVVADEGAQPIQCTPAVFTDGLYDGGSVGIYCHGDEKKSLAWGVIPFNLIAAWRATEMLSLLTKIDGSTQHDAYAAAGGGGAMEEGAHLVIDVIGKEKHGEIMAAQVPPEYALMMIDLQKKGSVVSLGPIIWAVRDGTLAWRQEFADAGLLHPDVLDANEVANDAAVASFEPLKSEYCKFRTRDRRWFWFESGGSWNDRPMESALLVLLRKGRRDDLPDDVVIALAGLVSDLHCKCNPLTYSGDLQEAVDIAVDWLCIRAHQQRRQREHKWHYNCFWRDPITRDKAYVMMMSLLQEELKSVLR